MKKYIKSLLFMLVLLIAITPCVSQQVAAEAYHSTDYAVEGGRMEIDFENENDYQKFDLYTEFDRKPWQMDGAMYAWSLAEQKMILRDKTYEDVDVSVDISTINADGKFDSGIYVYVSAASGTSITGWNVNVEHSASQATMDLKLHRFEGSWKGIAVEVLGLPYEGDTVHLRVVVKDGVLYAFYNHRTEPTLTYEIGSGSGAVGLRNFYSPNYFDNFTVTGAGNAVQTAELDAALALAQEEVKKPLAQQSLTELQQAITLAENAVTQAQTDNALLALNKALERSVSLSTFEQLQALLAQVEEIKNPNNAVYTENSWNSFTAVKNICLKLTNEDTEYDISYWYERLERRASELIAFVAEGE